MSGRKKESDQKGAHSSISVTAECHAEAWALSLRSLNALRCCLLLIKCTGRWRMFNPMCSLLGSFLRPFIALQFEVLLRTLASLLRACIFLFSFVGNHMHELEHLVRILLQIVASVCKWMATTISTTDNECRAGEMPIKVKSTRNDGNMDNSW